MLRLRRGGPSIGLLSISTCPIGVYAYVLGVCFGITYCGFDFNDVMVV